MSLDDQIIYALVSRGSDVLAEHTDTTGNFEQITRQLLKRIPAENKIMSYVYPKQKYVFHYIVDHGITYLCLTDEEFDRMVSFRFLEDMKNKFVDTYGDRAKTAIAYSFNPDFQGVIRRLMETANDPRNKTYRSTDSKIYEVNEEKVLEGGEKIKLLVHKSDDLDEKAMKFNRHSKKLKNRMLWKNIKLSIIFCIPLCVIPLIMLSPAVAALVFAYKYKDTSPCHGPSYTVELKAFLYTAGWIDVFVFVTYMLLGLVAACSAVNYTVKGSNIPLCVLIFTMVWAILGLVMYTDQMTDICQQTDTAKMIFSWCIIKLCLSPLVCCATICVMMAKI